LSKKQKGHLGKQDSLLYIGGGGVYTHSLGIKLKNDEKS